MQDDRDLIDAALAGDRPAERALYERHVERVYRLAYRMTGDRTLAEDLTQETFVRAFDRLGTFRRESSFSTWLHSIAVSVTLNELRREAAARRREQASAEAGRERVSGDPEPDLKRALHAALDDLSETLRSALVLHDLEGFTHEEIAEMLGIPAGTSKARVSRAREQLRRVFEAVRRKTPVVG